MGGVNQLNDSHGRSRDHFPYISIEGTSARTRSFSFEEVMLRRKHKNVVAELTEESDQSKELLNNIESVQVAENFNLIEVSKPEKVSEDLVRSDFRRQDSKKEEFSSNKKEKSKNNHEIKHGAETDAEIRHAMYKNTKDKHLKNVREDHHRRNNEQFEGEYGKEIHKKHRKDILVKDLGVERGRRPERDIGSLHDAGNSVKIKSEIHRSELKRHDVHKPQDVEYEKRGRRYEEPKPRPRRSRSREFDRFRERSASLSPRKREWFKHRPPSVSPGAWNWANRRSPSVSPRAMRRHNRKSPSVSHRTRQTFNRRSPFLSPRAHNLSNQRSPSISPRAQKRFHQRPDSTSPKPHKRSHRRSSSTSPRAPKRSHRRSDSATPKQHKRSHRRSRSTSPRTHKRSHQSCDSISPRAQMHSQYVHYSHEDGDSSPHSFREKSGKERSETNRPRASRNGASDRQQGSGLGGYSPRKRKTVTVTKTLSSPLHSPDKKAATWDQPPADATANAHLATPTTEEFRSPIPVAAIPGKSQSASLSNIPTMPLDISLESVQLTQATRPKRRLYIENLPNSASDKAVIEWLNDFLRSSAVNRIPGNSPCISCIINKEKCQAVVEFLTPEDATTALSLNEKSFSGSVLKIRRPKDFVDPTNVIVEKAPDGTESHAVSDIVKNSPHKIFIGGISKHITSGMLMEIVRSFGPLKAYQFEVNAFDEQYAYLEYLDPGVTSNACTCLNGMKLGGQMLTVVKAFLDWNLDEEHVDSLSSNEIPAHAKPLLATPTRVLKLTNVFNMEEFMMLPDPEVEEILEDVRIECGRFGTIKSVNVARQAAYNPTSVCDYHPNAVPGEKVSDIKTSSDPISPILQPDEEYTLGNPITDVSFNKKPSTPSLVETPSDSSEVYVSNQELLVDAICVEPNEDANIHTTAEAEQDSVLQDVEKVTAVDVEKVEHQTDLIPSDAKKPLVSDEEEKIQESPLAIDEERKAQDSGVQAFEAGCILVEFMREESACMAAHCLNGRPYDGRVVEVSFVLHEVYLEQFPRR